MPNDFNNHSERTTHPSKAFTYYYTTARGILNASLDPQNSAAIMNTLAVLGKENFVATAKSNGLDEIMRQGVETVNNNRLVELKAMPVQPDDSNAPVPQFDFSRISQLWPEQPLAELSNPIKPT